MAGGDPFNLERFVTAQNPVFETVLEELRRGAKRSHWMWFVFPQLAALGRSPTARFFGIASLEEARAYLAHPVLGPRLALATRTVLAVEGRTLVAIFGPTDAMKFRSSMTLFGEAAGGEIFRQALATFCTGAADEQTLALLGRPDNGGGRAGAG
jgi:uncharacterized protein (DUF1810 family)